MTLISLYGRVQNASFVTSTNPTRRSCQRERGHYAGSEASSTCPVPFPGIWFEFAEGVIPCCAGTGSFPLGWSLRTVLPLCLDGWGIDSDRQNGVAICSSLVWTKD